MGKSTGNFIDLERLRALSASHSQDALRYYLLRAAPFGSDLDFSRADFDKAYKELSDVLGNCLNRILKMVGQYRDGVLPTIGQTDSVDEHLVQQTAKLPAAIRGAYGRLALQDCVTLPIELARATNGYIDATKPWSLNKDPAQAKRLDTVLNRAAQAIKTALVALLPVLPQKAVEGLGQLGISVGNLTFAELSAGELPAGQKLGEGQPLFPKVS
jgi:methionyl-tRNA synthetase